MTEKFFADQMTIVFEDFGRDEYTTNRLKIIWESCKDLPDKNFAAIVRHFQRSRSVKWPPLPDHFIEEAINQRKTIRLNSEVGLGDLAITASERKIEGLAKVLEMYKAKDLNEAIRKVGTAKIFSDQKEK